MFCRLEDMETKQIINPFVIAIGPTFKIFIEYNIFLPEIQLHVSVKVKDFCAKILCSNHFS